MLKLEKMNVLVHVGVTTVGGRTQVPMKRQVLDVD